MSSRTIRRGVVGAAAALAVVGAAVVGAGSASALPGAEPTAAATYLCRNNPGAPEIGVTIMSAATAKRYPVGSAVPLAPLTGELTMSADAAPSAQGAMKVSGTIQLAVRDTATQKRVTGLSFALAGTGTIDATNVAATFGLTGSSFTPTTAGEYAVGYDSPLKLTITPSGEAAPMSYTCDYVTGDSDIATFQATGPSATPTPTRPVVVQTDFADDASGPAPTGVAALGLAGLGAVAFAGWSLRRRRAAQH